MWRKQDSDWPGLAFKSLQELVVSLQSSPSSKLNHRLGTPSLPYCLLIQNYAFPSSNSNNPETTPCGQTVETVAISFLFKISTVHTRNLFTMPQSRLKISTSYNITSKPFNTKCWYLVEEKTHENKWIWILWLYWAREYNCSGNKLIYSYKNVEH